MSAAPSIQKICDGLSRYYKSLNKPYDALFTAYCEEIGLEDGALERELEEDPEQCLLADFDDNFPFNGKNKAQFIVDLIRKIIADPDITFDANKEDIVARLIKQNNEIKAKSTEHVTTSDNKENVKEEQKKNENDNVPNKEKKIMIAENETNKTVAAEMKQSEFKCKAINDYDATFPDELELKQDEESRIIQASSSVIIPPPDTNKKIENDNVEKEENEIMIASHNKRSSTSVSTGWKCEKCTLENVGHAIECDACLAPRPYPLDDDDVMTFDDNNQYNPINPPLNEMEEKQQHLKPQQKEEKKIMIEETERNKNHLQMFTYSHDFDANGIVYGIATDFGRGLWSNPGVDGKIRVDTSSIMHDSEPAYSILGRSCVRCVTKPEGNSWIIIDFTPKLIKPTHYSFKHYSSWDTEALRSWTFEGSNDGGSTWTLLAKHKEDKSLKEKKGATSTWQLADCDRGGAPSALDEFYSHFRILQTGLNSNKHYYLALSGFEIYGAMTDTNNMVSRPINNAATRDFIHEFDFDTNGLLYFLGTKCKTQQWQNPAQLGFISIKTSGLQKDSNPASCIVGRQSVRCVTESVENGWIIIDFHDYVIKPTRYTLRHYASWDTEALRNWRLEGSLDGKLWTVIREHHNDESLKFKGQSFTWLLKGTLSYFSMFRLFQFGVNSNKHYYLALSGFEVYGEVYRQHTKINWDQEPRNKSEHLRIDHIRNCVINTGSEDMWQTVKTQQALTYNQENGWNEFSVLVERCENTSNSWKFMVGIAPDEFTCNGNKQWLGSQKSYAYIGDTGGKCYDNAESMRYGAKWGNKMGDIITCKSNIIILRLLNISNESSIVLVRVFKVC